MKLATITDRCIQWNEQRYDQVYDYELAARLLLEETEELYAATDPVERLDAIGDIMFVAIGVFWKLGFNKEQVEDIFHREDLATLSMEDANHVSQSIILFGMDELSNDLVGAYPGLSLACYSVFITALGALRGMGLQYRVYDVVHAICDSNATKEVKGKVDASVKANVVKGAGFVPPTEALRAIYKDPRYVREDMN